MGLTPVDSQVLSLPTMVKPECSRPTNGQSRFFHLLLRRDEGAAPVLGIAARARFKFVALSDHKIARLALYYPSVAGIGWAEGGSDG